MGSYLCLKSVRGILLLIYTGLERGRSMRRIAESWVVTLEAFSKLNVDGAARGNHRPFGMRGVVHERGEVKLFFSELIGRKGSNEAKLLGMRSILAIWFSLSQWG